MKLGVFQDSQEYLKSDMVAEQLQHIANILVVTCSVAAAESQTIVYNKHGKMLVSTQP